MIQSHTKQIASLLFVTLLFTNSILSQLSQSTPEEQGVSSSGISDFLDAITKSKNDLHGIVFVRHGKVIAEGYAKPYAKDLKHTMYSTSKSFTSTAIGFAVSEKKITVNDKVVSFFPDQLPDTVSAYLAALTIKDLLTMSVGHKQDPTGTTYSKANWVKEFLALPITDTPGKKFLYNSLATFMLSAIIQKVTGQKVIDYLEPRLFKPLGIQNIDWETNAEGINSGGWGLRLKTEDMAKFGQLFLQKGKWDGKQIIPAAWVEEATTAHIIQNPNATEEERKKSDWLQGYCYQFWRSRNNSFRADGAFGQYILVLPEKDAVIAITSETPNMQDELNLVWEHLLPAIKDGKLPANTNAASSVKQKLSRLSIITERNLNDSVMASAPPPPPKKIYNIQENAKDIKSISFNFQKNILQVDIETATGKFPIAFGSATWQTGTTTRKGPSLTGRAKNNLEGLAPFKIAGKYRWKDANTLELVLQYLESTHREIWRCSFDGGTVTMEMRNSITMMQNDKPDVVLSGK